MKILHLHDRLSTRGGAEHYLWDVIASTPVSSALAYGTRDPELPPLPCPSFPIEGLAAKERAPIELGPLLSQVRPDLIHIHNVMNPEVYKNLEGIPTLTTLHDHRTFCPGQGKWTLQKTVCTQRMSREECGSCFEKEEYFLRSYGRTEDRLDALRAHPVTAVSQYMKRELEKVGVQVHDVIPPGIEPRASVSISRASKPYPAILFVGRLVSAKGVWNALEAWKLSGTSLPLVFVGTGRERGDLERAGCMVTGWLSREETRGWYEEARAVLFPPNWQEPFGMVGPEARNHGVPVVAWESGGVEDWFSDGDLVQYGDISGLAEALNDCLQGKDRPLGAPPQTLQKFGESWFRVYQEIHRNFEAQASRRKSG